MTEDANGATYTGTKGSGYNYTVNAVNASAVAVHPTFDLGSWYVYATVQRDDGTYVYCTELNSLFGTDLTTKTETIDKFYCAKDWNVYDNNYRTTLYQPGENVTFSLVRPKDSVNGDPWKYFAASQANFNTNSTDGASVDTKYTLSIAKSTDATTLTLVQGHDASVALQAYNGGEEDVNPPKIAPNLQRTDGTYFIIGRMHVVSGTENYNCYFVAPLDNSTAAVQTVTTTSGFTGKVNGGDRTEYLTGRRDFDGGLVFVPGTVTAEQALSKVLDNTYGLEYYYDENIVEGYLLRSTEGEAQGDDQTSEVSLYRLPRLQVAGQVKTASGSNATEKKDDAYYYVLAELEQNGVKSYAYQYLNTGKNSEGFTTASTELDNFTDDQGKLHFYQQGDTGNYFIVKSASQLGNLSAVKSGERYLEGQRMGSYTPSFAVDGDNVTAVLTETAFVQGQDHTVKINMLNEAGTAVAAPEEGTISKNYYVLATLKDKASGEVIAWRLLDVNE